MLAEPSTSCVHTRILAPAKFAAVRQAGSEQSSVVDSLLGHLQANDTNQSTLADPGSKLEACGARSFHIPIMYIVSNNTV